MTEHEYKAYVQQFLDTMALDRCVLEPGNVKDCPESACGTGECEYRGVMLEHPAWASDYLPRMFPHIKWAIEVQNQHPEPFQTLREIAGVEGK